MGIKNVMPDRHTYVGVLRACAKLGDINTAYDALQDMKLHNLPVTEYIYNELFRVYAAACGVERVREEHID